MLLWDLESSLIHMLPWQWDLLIVVGQSKHSSCHSTCIHPDFPIFCSYTSSLSSQFFSPYLCLLSLSFHSTCLHPPSILHTALSPHLNSFCLTQISPLLPLYHTLPLTAPLSPFCELSSSVKRPFPKEGIELQMRSDAASSL